MSFPGSEISILTCLPLIGVIASIAFYVITIVAVRRFIATRDPGDASNLRAAVTFLKPLKGTDAYLYENLRSLCLQDHPKFQILCGVDADDDDAVPVVRRLQREFPDVDLGLVIDGRSLGANHKVGNLHNMLAHARHEVVVIADSDIRVPPDHIRRIVAPLAEPGVGLVTCLYRAVNGAGFPARLETLFINTDFCPMVLVARMIETPRYAFGATIALRREVLDEIGGFPAFANHLADDYQLGWLVAERGYELRLSREFVDTIITVPTWRALVQHQVRWARTYRICRPGGYFSSIVTHGPTWALLLLATSGFADWAVLLAVSLLVMRGLAARESLERLFADRLRVRDLPLLFLKDLCATVAWGLAFTGDRVWWGGREFRVAVNGEMVDISPTPPVDDPVARSEDRRLSESKSSSNVI